MKKIIIIVFCILLTATSFIAAPSALVIAITLTSTSILISLLKYNRSIRTKILITLSIISFLAAVVSFFLAKSSYDMGEDLNLFSRNTINFGKDFAVDFRKNNFENWAYFRSIATYSILSAAIFSGILFFLDKIRSSNPRKLSNEDWEKAYKEIKEGSQNKGLWAQAIAKSNGEELKAEAEYLKLRSKQISQERLIDSAASNDVKSLNQNSLEENSRTNRKKFFLRFDEIAILAFIGMIYLFFIFVK